MGIIRRQSIKTSLAFVLGFLIGHIHVLWVLPYCLPPDEVGLVRVIVSGGSLLGAFMPLGTNNIVIRFFPFFDNKERRHYGFFVFAMLLPLLGALIVILLILLFRGRILDAYAANSPAVLEYFPYAIVLGVIITYQKVFNSYSRSLLRAFFPNLIRQVLLRTLTIAAVIFYFLSYYDLQGLLNMYLLAYGSLILVLMIYIGSLGQLSPLLSVIRISWSRMVEMTQYGLFVMLTSAGNLLSRNIDTLMLGALAGLTNTGIYTVSYFVGSLIELPKRSLVQISAPMLAKARKNDDIEEIQKIYEKSSVNNFLVGSFLFVCVWSNIDQLFDIIPNGATYQKGMTVVLLISAARSIDLLTGLTGQILVNSRFYRINLVAMLLLVFILILLNYILIPIYGLEGAAFATFCAVLVSEAFKVFFLWLKEGLLPFSVNTLKTILILTVAYLVCSWIPVVHDPWTTILARASTATVIFAGLAYWMKVSEDANELIDEKIRKLRA